MSEVVGIVGAGRMGRALVRHLAKNGLAPVAYDIDTSSRSVVEESGAEWADSLEMLAARSTIVLICVGYEQEAEAVLCDDKQGLLSHMASGSLIAVLSTVQAESMIRWAGMAEDVGLFVIDAAVCRGGWAADEGTLLSLIGGAEQAVKRFQPIASTYSSDIIHLGPIGSGQVCKAVNNLILWACLVANHEGLALASRYGVDPDAFREALLVSSASNEALRLWGKQTMDWAQDDLAIIADMAARQGVALPQTALNREICKTLKPRRYDLSAYGI